MTKLFMFWDVFQKMSRRHPFFTIAALLWILSPFDDLFLPVIDEVIIVLLWAWQAFKDHNEEKAKQLKAK